MSDKKVTLLKDVKASAVITDGKYSYETRMAARHAWWDHCEASRAPSIPTFREFWDDEQTYPFVV